jgi:hypothetical protein
MPVGGGDSFPAQAALNPVVANPFRVAFFVEDYWRIGKLPALVTRGFLRAVISGVDILELGVEPI